ncbi:hypothetical protein PMAYCL1PPCAC_00532, partial [Pristionchus mayeri]
NKKYIQDAVTLIHFYFRVLKHYGYGTVTKEAYSGEFDQLEKILQTMTKEFEQTMFGELVRVLQVPDRDTFDCAVCNRCLF